MHCASDQIRLWCGGKLGTARSMESLSGPHTATPRVLPALERNDSIMTVTTIVGDGPATDPQGARARSDKCRMLAAGTQARASM